MVSIDVPDGAIAFPDSGSESDDLGQLTMDAEAEVTRLSGRDDADIEAVANTVQNIADGEACTSTGPACVTGLSCIIGFCTAECYSAECDCTPHSRIY